VALIIAGIADSISVAAHRRGGIIAAASIIASKSVTAGARSAARR